MEQTNYRSSKKEELIATVDAMLSGKINLIEGLRLISSLRYAVGDPDNPVFIPIRGLESETDRFPIGKERANYDTDYLKESDISMEKYLFEAKQDILNACREILRVFS